jgi:transposase-like protein
METRVRRQFSEELQRHVVSEIESGRLSITEAAVEYCAAKSSVKSWLVLHGKFQPKRSIVEVVMKSETEKIAELEKALSEAHLKLRIYDEILNQAGKKYKVDLKKTFGAPPLENSKGRGTRSK